jgi:hypothetical protein
MIIPRVEDSRQTEIYGTSAPDSEKSGPLRPWGEISPQVRMDRLECLLGNMKETQLQESTRRKRAIKARRRREKRRRNLDASLNQQQPEFPTALPYGPPQIVGTVDIPPAAGTGNQPETKDWVPVEESKQDAGIEEDSESKGGVGRMNPPSEEKQIHSVKEEPAFTKAQIRRDRFPPKPLTPEAETISECKLRTRQGRGGNQSSTAPIDSR